MDNLTVIERNAPNAVIYDLSAPGVVKITLPPGSTWSSGLHWHETHDEYLKVIKGSIRVRLGNSWRTISATGDEQPEVKVDKYVWHEWTRAEPDEEVVVLERTDPLDNEKRLFFWNLNGVILNAPKLLQDKSSLVSRAPGMLKGPLLDFWISLNLFVIFAHLDNVPAFLDMPLHTHLQAFAAVDWAVSHAVLFLASWVGWGLGLQPVRREFTPQRDYTAWLEDKTRKQKNI